MQARILNSAEECLWAEFVMNHPLGNIHQTPEWGHFQSKIPGRKKYWIIVIEETPSITAHPSSESLKSPGGPASPNSRSFEFRAVSPSSSSKILAGTLLVRHALPAGYCWLYAPRGPLLNYENADAAHAQLAALMTEIKKVATQEKAIFLRVDPLIQDHDKILFTLHPADTSISEKSARADFLLQKTARESHSASGLPVAPSSSASLPPTASPADAPTISPLHFPHFHQDISGFQPDHTLVLDLTKSESDILTQMKPKGRYNIKLAEKKGVKIRQSNPGHLEFHSDLAKFYQILSETTSRDGFHGHNQEFYKNMLISLAGHATLYLAEYDGKVIAGALNIGYKDTATYYYGASSNSYRNVMAPYLLHWHAIKEAKANGYKFYDFFGIAPTHERSECASQEASQLNVETDPNLPPPLATTASLPAEAPTPPHFATAASLSAEPAATPHPWAGVTEFKKKFGGSEVSYLKPQEYVFKKNLYFLYRVYKKLR